MKSETIKENIEKILLRIEKSAIIANRDPKDIKLLLATKTRSPNEINTVISLGYGLIGENRAQELENKFNAISTEETQYTPRETHFIGSLQSNKVNIVTQLADCIQSVDRIRIAKRINDYCKNNNISKKRILIQINTSNEVSKHGLEPNVFFSFLEEVAQFDQLDIRGLMTIGLQSEDKTTIRKGFAHLRLLRDKAIEKGLLKSDAVELSMGMSQDLELAIIEGATIIRVGSDIFGARNELSNNPNKND